MAATETQANIDEMIQAHERRRRRLALQAARQGDETPPHILTEIEDIDAELVQLRSAASVKISDTLVEQLGPTGRYQLWMSHIMRLDTDIGRLSDRIDALHDKFDQVLIALATKGGS